MSIRSFLQHNRKTVIISAAAALVVIGGVLALILPNRPVGEEETPTEEIIANQPLAVMDAELTIIADKDTVSGIDETSGFIIKSPQPISQAALASQLSILPQVEFTLQQRTDNELYLEPQTELDPDTIYNIFIEENDYEPPLSWAFQTKNHFRLSGAFPANEGRGVPINSGIELYFSQSVADISQFITITPPLPARCEQFSEKTVVLVPSANMEYATDYTVTLSAGLPSLAGDELGEEHSFSFRTENVPQPERPSYYLYAFDGLAETFTSTDPIYIKLYASNVFADAEVKISLYRYPSFDAYMAALKADVEYMPTEGLAKILEYNDRLLMNNDMYWNIAFLPLQENPGLGWYLVDIKTPEGSGDTDNQHAQKLLQITDISVYSQTANDQTLFWLNDAATSQPIAGASITVAGQKATSDQNGLALLEIAHQLNDEYNNRNNNNYYGYNYWGNNYSYYKYEIEKEVRIQQGEQQYGAYLDLYSRSNESLERLYYTYVYTDRAAYRPDDTVHFWGMILPRTSLAVRPDSLVFGWTDGGEYPDGVEIEVRPDGTFQGEIELEKFVSGWKYYSFSLGDRYLTELSFMVVNYVKPIYTAQLKTDKKYYRKNENITATASVSFYDGTPAEGLELKMSYENRDDDTAQLRLDENGRGQATFTPSTGTSWYPRYDDIYSRTYGAEDETLYSSVSAKVFPSDYMLQSEAKLVEDGFMLEIEGYKIDFNQVDSNGYFDGYDSLRGASADMRGQGTLTEVVYIKRKTGDYYDFLNKVTVERFTYDRIESIVEYFSLQGEDGRFTSPLFNYPYKDDNHYYYFDYNCVCPDGSTLEGKSYVSDYNYRYDYGHDSNIKQYSFRKESAASALAAEAQFFNPPSSSYGLNERIYMLLCDEEDQIPEQGRLLYTILGTELFSYETVNGSRFSFDFKPRYVPNALVVGAYFDGKHIFSVSSNYFYYDYAEYNELHLSVKPDKERYQPGEEVNVKLSVMDRQGQGKAANYLLSVADEAAFAIMEQSVEPLYELYEEFYFSYSQYASYIQPYDINYGAECGDDGGDDRVRSEFVDTVAFISGQTDAKGEATIKFKLADNLTSWRLTSIAFSESIAEGVIIPYAGKDIKNIECGLPFFINQVLNEKYLEGDSIGLSLRGAGTAIRNSDTVNYEISLSGPTEIKKSAQALAGDFCQIDLGTLPLGAYKVLIRANCGNYKDALEKEIEVVDSLLNIPRYIKGDLSDGLTVSATRFPVSLVFYDIDNTLFYDILYQMLYSYGKRVDQIIARALAGKRLNEVNGDSYYTEELDIDAEEINSWYYGLRLFPYAEYDPVLTAKAAAVAPEFLNRAALADYFKRILDNTSSAYLDIAAAYMGLGALKRPVLLDLRKLFAEARESDDFTVEETLYLAIGLALFGDTGTARVWYEDEIHGKLQSASQTLFYVPNDDSATDQRGLYSRVRRSSPNDATHADFQLTAEIAMLACLINHEDHYQLLSYLTSYRSLAYLPLFELATYVGKYSPKPVNPASLSYQLAGKTIQHTFDKRRQLYLELGETQLEQADFKVLEGKVGYHAYYMGGFNEAEKTLPAGVSISHQLSSQNIKLGDELTITTTVTFSNEAPVCYYDISQIVPSGFRFLAVENYSYYDSDWHYRVGERGMLELFINPLWKDDIFKRRYMPSSITFSYKARAVLPGTYIMEAPALSYSGSNTLFAGERHQISVGK